MQADQTDRPRDNRADDADLFDFVDLFDGGRAAFASLLHGLQQAALPPGAVIEIEFAVRGRAVRFDA